LIPLRVLILEDRPDDANLMVYALRKAGYSIDSTTVWNEPDFIASLQSIPAYDLILADYHLPGFDAIQALQILKRLKPDLPAIIVSGVMSEEEAVECIRQGASDYLLKDRMARLGSAVANVLSQKNTRIEKAKAEQALKTSEVKLQHLFDQSPVAIYLLDPQGTIIDCNPAMLEMTGASRDKLIGFNMLTQAKDHTLTPSIRKALTGERVIVEAMYTTTLTQRSGYYRYILQPVYIDDALAFVQVLAENITDRKISAGRLSKLNEVFLNFSSSPDENIQQLVETCGEMLGATSSLYNRLDGHRLVTKGAWNVPTDYQYTDDAHGHICFDVIQSPTDNPFIVRNLQQSEYFHSDPNVAQYQLQTYMGMAVKWQNVSIGSLCVVYQNDLVLTDEDQNLISIIASALGVEEERRQAEAVLRLLSSALEAAANAIIITDSNGSAIWINNAYTRLTGYDRSEALGTKAFEPRIHQALIGRFAALTGRFAGDESISGQIWETIRTGQVWHGELISQRKDGTLYSVEQTITPLKSPNGGITHYISIQQDITARVENEKEILQRNRELDLLFTIISQATSILDPLAVVESLIEQLVNHLGVSRGGAVLKEENTDNWYVAVEYPARERSNLEPSYIPTQLDTSLQVMLETKKQLLITDTRTDPHVVGSRERLIKIGIASMLLTPLIVRGEMIGSIGLDSFAPRQFTEEEMALAWSATSAVAQAIDNASMIEKIRARARELELVSKVATALRSTITREQMMPIVLDEVMSIFQFSSAAIYLRDITSGELTLSLSRGQWNESISSSVTRQVRSQIIKTGRLYLKSETDTSLAPDGNMLCVPLRTEKNTIGVICIGRHSQFTDNDTHLLSAIGDITANAFWRASLDEETQRRVRRMTAIHNIDLAITASQNLRVTMNVLLEQVIIQLGVNAASIMLFNQATQTLELVAQRGFHTGMLKPVRMRIDETPAGRAILDQRLFILTDLSQPLQDASRPLQDASQLKGSHAGATQLHNEGFISYAAAPLVAKGQIRGILEIYQRSLLQPDDSWKDFLETLAGQAAIAIDNNEMFESLQRSNQELALAYDTTLEGWARALELHDEETEGHTLRVTEMTIRLAQRMRVRSEELVRIRRGTILHDIGKMGIPDSILLKPDPLTEAEWVIMRQHPVYAYQLLSPVAFLRPCLDIPYYHHERWDGSGYPTGLREQQIPLPARIFAVVDVWDALRSDRPYRKAWPDQKILDYLREQSGLQFDPLVVQNFLEIWQPGR
jgi:PAS domain S-box-containing protein